MPIYRYKHSCGYEHDQFLKADKDSVLLTCERCGGGVTARQVRDNTVKFAEKNDVVGILRDEKEST